MICCVNGNEIKSKTYIYLVIASNSDLQCRSALYIAASIRGYHAYYVAYQYSVS